MMYVLYLEADSLKYVGDLFLTFRVIYLRDWLLCLQFKKKAFFLGMMDDDDDDDDE